MQEVGAYTQYIDLPQVLLYVFWGAFLVLVLYLHREGKREGYPLRSDRGGTVVVEGFPKTPEPKTYHLLNGGTTTLPSGKTDDHRELAAIDGRGPGDPIIPTGNPMIDGIGAASYAERADHPDEMINGDPRIVPMSKLSDEYFVATKTDPRGLAVVGADGEEAGTVSDIWLDRMEFLPRYYEVSLYAGGSVLLPMMFANVKTRRKASPDGTLAERLVGKESYVNVVSILASQFSDVPKIKSDSQITLLEEDKIQGYYGGGALYATPERLEPIL
jgi:photosynthetic reaction center H subunit